MGQNHVNATLNHNSLYRTEPEYTEFSAGELPYFALIKTASVDTQKSGGTTPTNSAAAGTALACEGENS